MKTAVVHDWLTGMRGGEFVLEEILGLVPGPTIFTLFHFPGSVSPRIEEVPIRTSFLQRLPLRRFNYRNFLPLFPAAIESFDLSEFDLVVSNSHCVAKGAVPRAAPHLCYCNTPVRYAYDQFDAYFSPSTTRLFRLRKFFIERLRKWDQRTSSRVTDFLANSHRVAERIESAYGRASRVVPPPVDTEFFSPTGAPVEGYALCVGALVPYKRFDRAIEWANRTRHPLLIVGGGPEERRLRKMAGSSVYFEKSLTRTDLRERYRRCAFFLQPGEEDFGMASVEVQACGRPAVALARGGIADVITAPDLGVLYEENSVEAIAAAVDSLARVGFNPRRARENGMRFSKDSFRAQFRDALSKIAGH